MKNRKSIFRKTLLCNTLLASSVLATSVASAAGFALREQSAAGQGSSFAGVAAGGTISTAFWNPANTGEANGTEVEVMGSIISAKTEVKTTGTSNFIYAGLDDTGDVSGTSFVPAVYFATEATDSLAWGVSLTAPYGSSTEAKRGSKSQYVSLKAESNAINLSPTVSYDVNQNTSLGFGLLIQQFDVSLQRAIPVGAKTGQFSKNDPTLTIEGDDLGTGFTAGITHQMGNSTVGLGYRSSIKHELDGSLTAAALGVNAGVTVDIETPASYTLGTKHQVSDKLNLGFTLEKVDWSSVGTLPVVSKRSGSVVVLGGNPVAIPLNYKDTNYYSFGGDYQYSKDTVLRAGLGLDETVTRDNTRTTQLPDNDRYWLSLGFSKNLKSGMRFDLGYTYVWLKDKAVVNIGPGHSSYSGLPYTGESDPTVHILSAGITKSF